MAKIKGGTSKILRAAFKEFRFMPSLWKIKERGDYDGSNSDS